MSLAHLVEHCPVPLGNDPKTMRDLLLEYIEGTDNNPKDLKDVRLMGMTFDPPHAQFQMSYYVGADWFDKKKGIPIVVRPKIQGIDFQTMLMKCFDSQDTSKDLDNIFYIRTEDDPIKISSKDFQIEPLLIIYFLNLIQKIVRKGLRHDYVIREERLNGRIKGKILMKQYLSLGIAKGRKDQVECRYQEYSIDCLDNRILKTALLLCGDTLCRNRENLGHHVAALDNMYNNAITAFERVSSDVSLQDLQRVHVHPMYKDYRETMPLAKMIIRKQGYCVGRATDTGIQMFPPFIINMPLLFERYVYSLLLERYKGNIVGFQEKSGANILDFSKKDEHMILDTKYIPKWDKSIIHENVRQLSGYARHRGVRNNCLDVHDESFICPCMVIYPSIYGVNNFMDFPDTLIGPNELPKHSSINPIPDYIKFYKLPIKLPVK